MTIFRPCLRCGRENSSEAETCAACSGPLEVWASEADRRPVRAAVLSSGLRRVLLGALAVVAILLAGWLLTRGGNGNSEPQGASWRRPETVAAWASERLARRRAPAERALALVETRTARPRRLLLTAHAPEFETDQLVRAAAEVLLAARDGGERLLIHAALLEHGPVDDRRSLLLPASVAAQVLADELALASLIDTARRGGLPALQGAPLVLAEGPGGPTGVRGHSSAGAESGEGDSPPDGAEADPSDPQEPSGRPGAETTPGGLDLEEAGTGLHVGLGTSEPQSLTPAHGRAARTPMGTGEDPSGQSAPAAGASSGRKPMPVSVLKGAGKRLAHSYEAGEQQVVLARVWLHPRTKRALILRELKVEPHGSLNDVEGVDFVYLVHDRNGNGRRDPTDEQIGDVVAFVDDDEAAVFEDLEFSFGADGALAKLLLIVDFIDRNEGGSIMLTVPAPDGVSIEEVATGAYVRVDGLPFKGSMTTLNGDLEPDPFQAELDRLAAEEE